ncbi:pyridoxamine 5'-phosphate oxidase family protein, partial [Streptomyces sp. 2MCAF27]
MTTNVANEEEQKPGAGPAPRVLTDEELSRLLQEQQFSVLATVKRSGHPHLSTVLHRWSPEERVVRISTTPTASRCAS